LRPEAGLLNAIVRGISHLILRINVAELKASPKTGPALLVINHTNFLDAPITYVHAMPRPVRPVAKVETWDNPLIGGMFTLWNGIPIKRGEADLEAFRLILEALKDGHMVAVAPEGTRSGDGRLLQAKPGIAVLALRSGAPIYPMAIYGHHQFWQNLKKLRRSDFIVRVGKPFRLVDHGQALSREVRQQMTDEIMGQMALLMPEELRGYYAGPYTTEYLEFLP